jgi:predicted aspartyl protease
MTRLVILTLACLAISGCASELVLDMDDALAVIPRQISDAGHIVVETKLDGRGPFRFVIDTGSSISVVYEGARTEAGIEPVPNIQVHVLGMTGSGFFPLGRVSEIRVGDEVWNNARVALLPDTGPIASRIDGIFGIDFLSRYAVLYSQGERVLRFYPRELVADDAYRGWERIVLRDLRVGDGNAAVLVFDMRVDAEYIPTVFDLGATVNVMNRRAARALDIMVRRPRRSSEVHGVSGSTEVLAELRVWRLWIDNSLWRNKTFLIGEFPVFEVLGLDRRPAAIVGVELFGRRDFIIDFARRRLLVKSRN